MKRFQLGILSALTLSLGAMFIAPEAQAVRNFADKKYSIEVHDQRSVKDNTAGKIDDATVLVFVYDAGTKTLSTLYSDTQRTAKSNPISRSQFDTDDGIKFYGGASSYDIFLAHSDGSVASYTGVTPTMHRLNIDRTGSARVLVFPMVFNAGGTEVDTGLDLPKYAQVYDVAMEVVTTDATETVSIGLLSSGTGGDADGFLLATSVANAGFFQSYAITDGSTEDYVSATRKGALLGIGSTGTDGANDFGQPGGPGYVTSGSNTTRVSYTPSSSDTFAGYGYLYFRLMR